MDDKDRIRLLGLARRSSSLSSNDMYELKRIDSSGLQPFANELRSILNRAHSDDDAVLLKAAIKGIGSLSTSEKFRLDEAIGKRGKRIPG